MILAVLHLAVACWLIHTGRDTGPTASDQRGFHLPTIRQFAGQWPHADLSDYPSATTPGYHLLMAALARGAGDAEVGPWTVRLLQTATALLTAGMLATACWGLGRLAGTDDDPPAGWAPFAPCLPFACSQYVFPAGVWLVPHNLAWWCVLGILLLAIRRRVDRRTFVVGAVLLGSLAFVRQIHVWAAAPLLAAAWLGGERPGDRVAAAPWARARLGRIVCMLAATLPAVLALAYFYRLWGGLTPPGEPWAKSAFSPTVPAVVLSLFGIYGLFFSGYLLAAPPPWPAKGARWIAGGLLIGAAVGLMPQSTFDPQAGRWSGIWNIVRHLPAPFGRSPLIVLLSTLGGGVLALWLRALPQRSRWIMVAAIAGITAAHCVVGQSWQRYYEPFVLLTLAIMAAEVARGREGPALRWAVAGPAVLATMLAGLTILSLK